MRLIDADVLKERFYGSERAKYTGTTIVHAIESMPAIESEPVRQWIPCSERIPEEGQSVLAVVDGNVREAGYSYDAFSGSGFYRDAREIEWWMPLPEPPKGGADNAAD